jgi:hypothetical protein
VTGADSCQSCPSGYYCDVGTSIPISCPMRYFCPNATSLPVFCPNGTYSTSLGLSTSLDCTPCSARSYCTQGLVQDLCAAGYFCKFGQSVPTPEVNVSQFMSLLSPERAILDYLSNFDGGPCPPGSYCPRGTADPISCQNGTVREGIQGTSISDCGPCPAGSVCLEGLSSS